MSLAARCSEPWHLLSCLQIQGAAIAAAFWAGAGLLCVVAVSLALVLSIAALSLLGLGAVLFFVALTAGAWAFVLSWAAAWAYIAMSTLGWASKAMHRCA